jgi:hypothetical protein
MFAVDVRTNRGRSDRLVYRAEIDGGHLTVPTRRYQKRLSA